MDKKPQMSRTGSIRTKRIYEPASPNDGLRILVDRIWPRGMSKERAKIDLWVKDLAPSHELRKWYRHDPAKWEEFRARYAAELEARENALEELLEAIEGAEVATLVFSSKEEKLNNASALQELLEERGGAREG